MVKKHFDGTPVKMVKLILDIPEEMSDWLNSLGADTGMDRSNMVRWALWKFYTEINDKDSK